MNLIVDYLSLLVTRNCNLRCAHCLRGENSNTYMTDEVIETTFSKIKQIKCLVFSGGEPFYSKESIAVMHKIVDAIEKYSVEIGCFQIITNGTIYNEDIENILKRLLRLTSRNPYNMLLISDDEYHKSEIKRLGLEQLFSDNLDKYKKICNDLSIGFKMKGLGPLYNLGRAKKLTGYKAEILTPELINYTKFRYGFGAVEFLNIFDNGMCSLFELSYEEIEKKNTFNICDADNLYSSLGSYLDDLPGTGDISCNPIFKNFM